MEETNQMKKRVVVVGAGFSGLSAAANLAYKGFDVTVVEQHASAGGRNRLFHSIRGFDVSINELTAKNERDGFLFELGPSWLWMPDIHRSFYENLGRNMDDYVRLKTLEPAYKVVFDECEVQVPNSKERYITMLESIIESDVQDKELQKRVKAAVKKAFVKFYEKDATRYDVSLKHFLHQPSLSLLDFTTSLSFKSWREVLLSLHKMGLFKSQNKRVHKMFDERSILKGVDKKSYDSVSKSLEKIKQLLEWPVIFVGGSPKLIPELYSLVGYSAIEHGTLIPENGMYELIVGMKKACTELGVKFHLNSKVVGLSVHINSITIDGVYSTNTDVRNDDVGLESGDIILHNCEYLVYSGDMAHFEMKILPSQLRMYNTDFWNSRLCSPCCLLFYVGLDVKLKSMNHHILFFDSPLYKHLDLIYSTKRGNDMQVTPTNYTEAGAGALDDLENPLFYVSVASKTNSKYAPNGCESLFILIPTPHYQLNPKQKNKIFENVLTRIENRVGLLSKKKDRRTIHQHVVYRKDFQHNDFLEHYNSLKGNAFGISNSFFQTAFLRPRMKSSKVKNLYYVGQSTVPGGGIPPCIISGQIASKLVEEDSSKTSVSGTTQLLTYGYEKIENITFQITSWIQSKLK